MTRATRRTSTASIDVAKRYVDHLNRIFNTTVSESRLVVLSSSAASEFAVAPQHGPIKLRPGQRWLHFRQAITVRRPQAKVIVQDASYTYSRSNDPSNEAAIVFMHHYHREGHAIQPQSHYHIHAKQNGTSISRKHFVTGRVSIEQVIAHLLKEQGVRANNDDEVAAMAILETSHRKFMNALRTDTPIFP